MSNIWDKVFKKNGPSKICGRQPLQNLLPQILLGQFLNTLSYLYLPVFKCRYISFQGWNLGRFTTPNDMCNLKSWTKCMGKSKNVK